MDLQKLEQSLSQLKENIKMPSFSMTLYTNNEYIHLSNGMSDVCSNTLADENTLYGIASCTKSLVAGTLCTLVDQGKINLDDKVKAIMPEFKMYDAYVTENLTVRDILCHRSGIQRHDLSCYPRVASMTEDDIVGILPYLKPNQPLRYKWQYSNLMYVLAGCLISKVAGEHWQEVMKKNIFEPLGITRVAFSSEEAVTMGNCARPYKPNPETGQMEIVPYLNMLGSVAAAGLYMSSAELAKWNVMLLNKGRYNGVQILSEEMCHEMTTTQMVIRQPVPKPLESVMAARGYGLGLSTEMFRGHRAVGHSGDIDGFMSYQFILPDDGAACAILTNAGQSMAAVIMRFIAYEYLLGGQEDWGAILHDYFDQEMKNRMAFIEGKLAEKPENAVCPVDLKMACGHYSNPGYGAVDVTTKEGNLMLKMYDCTFTAKHYADLSFTFDMPQLLKGIIFEMELHTNQQGKVTGFSASLDYETDEKIYFERKDAF